MAVVVQGYDSFTPLKAILRLKKAEECVSLNVCTGPVQHILTYSQHAMTGWC